MMRSHGTDLSREIYHFGAKGEPIYDAIERTIRLRYAMLPYIYSTAWEVTNKQSSFMRPLIMDFAEDKNVWDIKHQFMFGKSILVAPVVEAQYTPEKIGDASMNDGWIRSDGKGSEKSATIDFTAKKNANLYLPAASTWYDFWTNERLDGGQEITKETSIDLIPLYIKAGTILPIGPEVQYATEKPWDNLEIRIYEGADGEFTLYEDENDNYNYEKGIYSTITFGWNDARKVLTIGCRDGSFPGILKERRFRIVRVGRDKANGMEQVEQFDRVVDYNGKKVTLQL